MLKFDGSLLEEQEDNLITKNQPNINVKLKENLVNVNLSFEKYSELDILNRQSASELCEVNNNKTRKEPTNKEKEDQESIINHMEINASIMEEQNKEFKENSVNKLSDNSCQFGNPFNNHLYNILQNNMLNEGTKRSRMSVTQKISSKNNRPGSPVKKYEIELKESDNKNELEFEGNLIPTGLTIKEFNAFEFTADDQIRRYNKFNFEKGKNYFKYHYISERVSSVIKNNNIKFLNSTKFITNSNSSTVKFTSNHSINNNIDNQQKRLITFNFAPDDKNIIKYNSLYLRKIEKSIFLFNLKKFEESYNYLLENLIIKNESEFGEILLLTNGFDKSILGEFISKEKSPNKEFKILNSFINKIDFIGVKYLDSLRFVLSRVNLPKDSALILKIIEFFSEVYIADNPDFGFKDSTSIYILTSTVLALNTMLTRSDISNMKIISKEEFIKMNGTVNRQVAENIYDELKTNKLDITYDYSELIYRRLIPKADFLLTDCSQSGNYNERHEKSPKTNNKEAIEKCVNEDIKESDKSSDISILISPIEGEELLKDLKKGEIFIKFGESGSPHPRLVRLTEDENKIIWARLSFCSKLFSKTKYLIATELLEVYIGTNSKIFEKYNVPLEFDRFCFSIESTQRTLDLRKDDEKVCKKWYKGIKYLIQKTNKRKSKILNLNNQMDHQSYNIYDEVVSNIWKNEVLPNWKIFRQHLELKINFKNDIRTLAKKKEKIPRKIYKLQ